MKQTCSTCAKAYCIYAGIDGAWCAEWTSTDDHLVDEPRIAPHDHLDAPDPVEERVVRSCGNCAAEPDCGFAGMVPDCPRWAIGGAP